MPARWTSLAGKQRAMIGTLAVVLVLAQWNQPYPETAPLHHLPTLVLLLAAPFLLSKWPMSDEAIACVVVFLLIHTIGGRYTYSNVPYDSFARWLTGHDLTTTFGFNRNHWDRFVHFAYGALAIRPASEALVRHLRLSRKLALYIALASVLATGALYEIFEWLLSVAMEGPLADAYNGQQGDIWDAQKDMALAALGALIVACFCWVRVKRRCRPDG